MGMTPYPDNKHIKTVKEHVDKYISNRIIGSLIFGSSIDNRKEKPNDIDIALFYLGKKIIFNQTKNKGKTYDIIYYPLIYLNLLDDEKIRNRSDTWYRTSLYVNLLKNSYILYDPRKIIQLYKTKILNWRWSIQEIQLMRLKTIESLKISKRMLEKDKIFESLLSIRDASYNYVIYKLMKKQLIPSPRPKDLYRKLKENIPFFLELFEEINGIDNIDPHEIQYILELYQNLWTTDIPKNRGAYSEYTNSLQIFLKKDIKTALLNLRYSLYLLLVELFVKNDIEMIPYNSLKHIMLYHRTKNFKQLNKLYQEIHKAGIDFYSLNIEKYIKKFKKLIW